MGSKSRAEHSRWLNGQLFGDKLSVKSLRAGRGWCLGSCWHSSCQVNFRFVPENARLRHGKSILHRLIHRIDIYLMRTPTPLWQTMGEFNLRDRSFFVISLAYSEWSRQMSRDRSWFFGRIVQSIFIWFFYCDLVVMYGARAKKLYGSAFRWFHQKCRLRWFTLQAEYGALISQLEQDALLISDDRTMLISSAALHKNPVRVFSGRRRNEPLLDTLELVSAITSATSSLMPHGEHVISCHSALSGNAALLWNCRFFSVGWLAFAF